MAKGTYKPEWTPENAGSEFAGRVMPGVAGAAEGAGGHKVHRRPVRARRLSLDDYEKGVLGGDRVILSRAITLVESNNPDHFNDAQELIQRILPHTGRAIRVGITGIPGAGKSTFIEALGCTLTEQGKKVAVLAVDPSSTISGGSILGDKTRMEQLARDPRAFIRPSPSGGTLGGVTRKSRETMLLCEAAGYDVILVETVGVGQSEITVRSMVDFFLLLVVTGAGDDLQGIKKGVIELSDAILVNKADGDNKMRARATRADYNQILHYLRPASEGWTPRAYVCSSLTGEGIEEIWGVISEFKEQVTKSGLFQRRRNGQTLEWVDAMADEYVQSRITRDPGIKACRALIREQVLRGELTATRAAEALIGAIEKHLFSRREKESRTGD